MQDDHQDQDLDHNPWAREYARRIMDTALMTGTVALALGVIIGLIIGTNM